MERGDRHQAQSMASFFRLNRDLSEATGWYLLGK